MGLPPNWWHDPAILRQQYELHGSVERASLANNGPSTRTLLMWWRKHGLPKLPKGPGAVPAGTGDDDGWLLAALKKAKDTATVDELADQADVSPRRVREALERLGEQGYRVHEADRHVTLQRVAAPTENQHKALFAGETYRFASLGDTHLSSKYEQLEKLHMAYDIIADEGITDVYHGGDLVCGYGVFRGQNLEVQHHTYAEQVEYATLNYPSRAGVTTRIIGGNHDLEGDFGKAGANPVVAVCNQRPDMEYLGDFQASVEFPQGTRLYLLHPKGSMGYAMDYKARKLVEGFEGGRKPNVMLTAHFHRAGWILARSVHVLFTACFESGGTFGPRLGLPDPAVGFWTVTMTIADDGSVVRFNPEFRHFFPGRKAA